MIYSMTAFARSQAQGDFGNLVCEIRSINHRYLEVSVYLPEILRVIEMDVRDLIRQQLKRGKIDCSFRYQPDPRSAGSFTNINTFLAQALCDAGQQIAGMTTNAGPILPADILRFPGVLETKEADVGILKEKVFAVLKQTLSELVTARGREGEKLKVLFFERLDAMQGQLQLIRERMPVILKELQEKLTKSFEEAKLALDPGRLEQEMVLIIQRMDIAEEIDRTETHINEVRHVLNQGGAIGRRLDFFLQELNREANTMGSKSNDATLTHAVVEMKVLIEQIREQVQNIE